MWLFVGWWAWGESTTTEHLENYLPEDPNWSYTASSDPDSDNITSVTVYRLQERETGYYRSKEWVSVAPLVGAELHWGQFLNLGSPCDCWRPMLMTGLWDFPLKVLRRSLPRREAYNVPPWVFLWDGAGVCVHRCMQGMHAFVSAHMCMQVCAYTFLCMHMCMQMCMHL